MPLIEESDLMSPEQPGRPDPGRGTALQIALSALAGSVCTVIWLATGHRENAWPEWVWMPLAVAVLAQVAIRWTALRARGARRGLALHAVSSGLVALLLVFIDVFTRADSGHPDWAGWPILGLLTALALHAVVLGPGRRSSADRERRALVSRVDELTRTRRGALDVQTVELRRIERDLHDGAQARLVALSLKLGRAEERLRHHPEAAELVTSAHRDADLAIGELRELARGIAPPILADRGIAEAVRALGRRSGIRVAVRADVPRRPPPSVELAAYFISAEALTNAVKHAGTATGPATATVTVDVVGSTLVVQVADDGPGGADPLGSGLAGLAQRVAALDGTFTVGDLGAATAGGSVGGTVVRAELPCGW